MCLRRRGDMVDHRAQMQIIMEANSKLEAERSAASQPNDLGEWVQGREWRPFTVLARAEVARHTVRLTMRDSEQVPPTPSIVSRSLPHPLRHHLPIITLSAPRQ